jgi:hypothetical protein
MSSGKVIKGVFGKFSEQPDAHLSEFDQSLISHNRFAVDGEHHEYDPVRGWVIRQNVEKSVSRFSYESFSAIH